jgi:polysaccharide export outer membrane protein
MVEAAKRPGASFRIVEIDSPDVAAIPRSGARMADIALAANDPVDVIRPGDEIQITVYEIGASLFTPQGSSIAGGAALAAGQPPGAAGATLPPMLVARDGMVGVPYVGPVQAAGLTPAQLADVIDQRLAGKSQSPQTVVAIRSDVGNAVVVMGEVKAPGRKPLTLARERLLDMVAIAGGPSEARYEATIRITRQGRSVEEPLVEIASGGADDIVLQPGDRIDVISRPRSFEVFGAAGKVSEIPFQKARITLAEAVARGGGPLDYQADPSAVFLFRPSEGVKPMATIYRLNLRDPRSWFIAQAYDIHDRDIIYIANARTNAVQKFFGLISNLVAPAIAARTAAQ